MHLLFCLFICYFYVYPVSKKKKICQSISFRLLLLFVYVCGSWSEEKKTEEAVEENHQTFTAANYSIHLSPCYLSTKALLDCLVYKPRFVDAPFVMFIWNVVFVFIRFREKRLYKINQCSVHFNALFLSA
jgi:hypothetical protein